MVLKFNLSQEQMKAVEMLGAGHTVSETARCVGVSRDTIYRCLHQDKNFVEAKKGFEESLYNGLWGVAVSEMYEVLVNGTANQKIPVIQLVAKLHGKITDKTEVTVKEETVDIDKFLAEVGVDLDNM